MKYLHFACGATYEITNEPEFDRNGNPKRLLTFAQNQGVEPPKKDGKHVNCLYGCPAKVKDSGRKEQKGWIECGCETASSEPIKCVFCRPVKLTGTPPQQ